MRARRIAMLGNIARKPSEDKTDSSSNQPASSSTSTPKPQTSEASAPKPKINVTPAAITQSNPNPFAQLGVQNSKIAGDESAATGSSRPACKRPAPDVDDTDSAPPAQKPTPQLVQQQQQKSETDEDYANRVLSQVFRVSVDPHHMTTPQGQRLIFLPNLNQELNDSGDSLKLSIGNLDQAIIEACSSWTLTKPLLEYLLPCWKRVVRASSTAKNVSAPRQEILDEAKRLCMSNCLFALTMPALYGFVHDDIQKVARMYCALD